MSARNQAAAWPAPADTAAAQRLSERFAALGTTEARFARSRRGIAAIGAIGGNSPYLSELALKEPAVLRAVITDGAAPTIARVLDRLAQTPPEIRRPVLSATLRRAKRQVALAVALADIGGAWALDPVIAALSDLAERTLQLAVDHLLLDAAARRELHIVDPRAPSIGSGFVVLGMGKLGARELNYSSDVDLVLIYDPALQLKAAPTMDGAGSAKNGSGGELAAGFAHLARGLVTLMGQRDAEGYVFRTDLRLRPDPAATPLAVSLPAALIYYESLGQNWERAAMLKARPVAGDLAVGHAFLDAIRPFIWRRGLDFAAVADIHAMKQRIDAHRSIRSKSSTKGAEIAGFDVKLGPGGIREIEFLAQTLQLVWGGRDPSLRDPATLGALRALTRAGHLTRAAAGELASAYEWLRRTEHRLQMVADRQTHALPADPAELDRFALFLGLPDAAALADVLMVHLRQVRAHYAEVFEAVPASAAAAPALDFSGPDPQSATLTRLAGLGFTRPEAIVAAVHGWQAGRVRALRSERARTLLGEMLPPLLDALAQQAQPDTAFTRFDQFLARLPAGVQLLSLMQRNPALLHRIAAVLGAAPHLADYLARVPQALDGLVAPGSLPPPARLLRERLTGVEALEDAIGAIRRAVHEMEFALSVDTLERRIDADAAGLARAALADAAIAALLPFVGRDIARRFGAVPGGAVAIVALGKAGSREMMAGSDLDLMLIYDQPASITESRLAPGVNGRVVPVSQYYTRLAQTLVAALTAPGPEGALYAVDMRLRPSGNAGPVAVSLTAFRRYHREHAWTWERMALTRARVIAASRPILATRVGDATLAVIEHAGSVANAAAVLKGDAAAMRARLARDLKPTGAWDIKHRIGGLMEVEFIAQVLQLVHAGTHPEVIHTTTRHALAALRDAALLTPADASTLIEADHFWRTVQGMLRVTLGQVRDPVLPAASAAALLASVRVADQAALEARMDMTGAEVRAVFERLIGPLTPMLTSPAKEPCA